MGLPDNSMAADMAQMGTTAYMKAGCHYMPKDRDIGSGALPRLMMRAHLQAYSRTPKTEGDRVEECFLGALHGMIRTIRAARTTDGHQAFDTAVLVA